MMRRLLLALALIGTAGRAHAQSQPSVPCGGGQACQAIRAADFVDSIGINVHLNNYTDNNSPHDPYTDQSNSAFGGSTTAANGVTTNVSAMVAALQFTGIHVVRGQVNYTEVVGRFEAILQSIPNLQLIAVTTSASSQQGPIDHITALSPVWSSVVAFEGLNESRDNGAYFPYKGLYGSAGTCAWQKDMFGVLQTGNQQHGTNLPMLAAPVADHAQFAEMASDAACVAAANASSGHSYVDTNPPTAGILAFDNAYNKSLPSEVQSNAPAGAPNWVTETGVTSNPYLGGNGCGGGADQRSQAIVNLETALSFKRLGVVQTALYELADDPTYDPNPGSNSCNREPHFGIFDYTWTKKDEAYALHNQFQVVNDTAANARSFTPGSLAFTIANAPANTYSLLMQQASGTWVAAIWPENPVWSYASGGVAGYEINRATVNATVTFPAMTSVTLYDPFGNGTSMTTTNIGAGTSATVPMTDHPIYLAMVAAAGGGGGGAVRGACTFGGGSL